MNQLPKEGKGDMGTPGTLKIPQLNTVIARTLRAAWILLTVAVLAVTLVRGQPGDDSYIFLIWSMTALTFPTGWAVIMAYGFGSTLAWTIFGVSFSADTPVTFFLHHSVLWLAMFIAGYFQWFMLIPRILKKAKNSQSAKVR